LKLKSRKIKTIRQQSELIQSRFLNEKIISSSEC
jgi:hypothetical protein